MTITRKLLAALALLLWPAPALALATNNPANIPAVPNIPAMSGLGSASAFYPTVLVETYYSGSNFTGSGNYVYKSSCPGTVDGGQYVVVTGVSGACWQWVPAWGSGWTSLTWGVVNSTGTTTKTDSTAFWKAAIAAATLEDLQNESPSVAPQTNHSIICPEATQSWVSDQLVLTRGVALVGQGAGTGDCQINVKATSTAIQASGVIRLGDNTFSDYNHYANNLLLNMNVQNGIGLDCAGCQDSTGFNDDFVYQTMTGPGIFFDGTGSGGSVNSFKLTHNQVWGSATRTAGGDGIKVDSQTYPADIDTNDVLSFTGHTFDNFAHFHSSLNPTSRNWTLEDSGGPGSDTSNGILFDGNLGVLSVFGATFQNLHTGIKINPAGSVNGVFTNLFRINGTTTIDNSTGFCGPAQTVTDVQVAFYLCGDHAYFDLTTAYFTAGLQAVNYIQTSNVWTVSALNSAFPCNSTNEGMRAAVSDATAPTFLGTLTGGSTVHAPAYCNGTNWVAG